MTRGTREWSDTETVWKATTRSGETCYFGNQVLAKAWAGSGTVESHRVKAKSVELAYPNQAMVSNLRETSDEMAEEIASLKERLAQAEINAALTEDDLREQLAECKKFSIAQYEAAWDAMIDRGVRNFDLADVIAGFDAAMEQKEEA